MSLTVQQTEFVLLEAGEYPATIGTVEAEEGQFGPQLKFKFMLDDGTTLLGWCSRTFNPKTKLYAWSKAAFGGGEIPRSYNLDTAHLENKRVRLFVTVEAGRDGMEYNKVNTVLPARRSTPPPVPAPVAAYPPDDLFTEQEVVPF